MEVIDRFLAATPAVRPGLTRVERPADEVRSFIEDAADAECPAALAELYTAFDGSEGYRFWPKGLLDSLQSSADQLELDRQLDAKFGGTTSERPYWPVSNNDGDRLCVYLDDPSAPLFAALRDGGDPDPEYFGIDEGTGLRDWLAHLAAKFENGEVLVHETLVMTHEDWEFEFGEW